MPTSIASRRLRPSQTLRRCSHALAGLLRGPSTHDQTELNIRYLYVEIVWAGVLSAAASFNSAFAVRLGATNAMVGWLSSIPSLIAVLMLVPGARFLEGRARRAPWVWGSLLIARLGYALVAMLPFLIAGHRAELLVALLIAISIPSTFFSTGFSPLLADVIPERERTRVFSARGIVVSATVAVLTFLAGRWLEASDRLHWAAFPLNYQVLYVVGFAGSMLSMVYLYRIRVPESPAIARPAGGEPRKPFLAELKTMFAVNPGFRAIALNTLVFDSGAWLVMPLYIIFFVRHLGATDGWIGLNSTLANLGVILGNAAWRRWLRKLGYGRALLVAAPLGAAYPILVGLFPNLALILAWGVVASFLDPGLSLSHFNILLKLCPSDRRTSYLAIFSTIMNAEAFVLPMIGVALAGVLGVRTLLLVGGGIRLAGAVLFYVNRIRVVDGDIG